jgi:TetR/AcrR family transcriptional regulator
MGMALSFKNLKEKEKEKRREYIIGVAEKLFLDKGYDNVPMSDIAEEVGVNRATLYLYFKNKDSLYFSVLLRGLHLMREKFRKAVKDDQNGLERLISLGRAFFEYYQEHPDYYRELSYIRAGNFNATQIKNADQQMIVAQELMDAITDSIKIGKEDGSIKKDLKPIETAVFVVNSFEKFVNPGVDMLGYLELNNITPLEYMEYSFSLLILTISNKNSRLEDK